ncbi:MAG: hypothetical protein K6D02_00580 [Lachnospiraceae bacterium]|nr:hypothetical protein [Lachnospiraceae bacterium]
MKGIDFIESLNDVDMKYIKEADERPDIKNVIRINWGYYASLAASFLLVIFSSIMLVIGYKGGEENLDTPSGTASLISSGQGLFWMLLVIGILGILITLFLIFRKKHLNK